MPSKGSQCFAINCVNRQNASTYAQGVSFHRFPNRKSPLYSVWIRNCRRTVAPGDRALVCSSHFTPESFDRTGQTVRLREGTIPTVFTLPEHLTDHNYSGSPSKWKRKLDEVEIRLDVINKKLRNTQRREKRAKKTCQYYVKELYELNLINKELETKLDSYGDIPLELFRKPEKEFSETQKDFALTLHLQSAKAYRYLRETVKFPLPNPRTLRRWMEHVDAKPGLNITMINTLCSWKAKTPAIYTRCCLIIDGMSIRQHIDYDSRNNTFYGYVNLGDSNDNSVEATEALVFMVVGLNGHWKAPVAYYFTKGLSAETQAELVSHCLDKLHSEGFEVQAITMDGLAANVAMCSILGAELQNTEDLKPTISNTCNHNTFVIFDPCHMVKLVRNLLQAYRTIISPDGHVSWKYITKLHDMQQKAGLRLANKLSKKHVLFQQQKMKVSLAVQVLSSSVAKALRAMHAMGQPEFKDCIPTAEFIENIDKLFDLMNSKSPRANGYKAPLSKNNIQYKKVFLQDIKVYLNSLKTEDNVPLTLCRRSMCIKGLLVNIDSLLGLSEQLFQYQHYFLTYKVSQDHLELFFNAIRRGSGWNNNPTARTFTSILRKIITRCGGIQLSSMGNCILQDSTELMQMTSTYVQPDIIRQDDPDNIDPFEESSIFQNYNCSNLTLSPLIENVLVYIAGWVVRKVLSEVSCDECREVLVSHSNASSNDTARYLLKLKDNGGLVTPSDGCIEIIKSSERHLRRMTNLDTPNVRLSPLKLQIPVIEELGSSNVFNIPCHEADTQDGIDNHYLSLIRIIVKKFYHLRQQHIVRLRNICRVDKCVRKVLTKTIIFKGQ